MKKLPEVLLAVEATLLFSDVDSVNNQIYDIKRDCNGRFEDAIIHYDLADEKSDNGQDCVSVRLELFRYISDMVNDKRTMWKDIRSILNGYDIIDYRLISE